jgi:hypothetical protein
VACTCYITQNSKMQEINGSLNNYKKRHQIFRKNQASNIQHKKHAKLETKFKRSN